MVVAQRAAELGSAIAPRDVNLCFMETEAAPGCRLFHASWGLGEHQGALSGLIADNEAPDTYPGQALAKIFRRWFGTEPKLEDAAHAARVAAYLFDAANRHQLVLSERDKKEMVSGDDWRRHLRLPELIQVNGQPGIVFWWVGANGPSEIRIHLDSNGGIRTHERFAGDFADESDLARRL